MRSAFVCSLLLALTAAPAGALVLAPAAAPGRSLTHQRPATALVSRGLLGVTMQEDGGGGAGAREKRRSRGRTATVARPKPKPKFDRKEDIDHEQQWRVLLHNDDVHTFDYVSMAIVKVVKTITRKKAHRITVQCHSMGTATVTTTWKQMAKTMCLKLQKFGLTSSIAPDAGPGGNGGGDPAPE